MVAGEQHLCRPFHYSLSALLPFCPSAFLLSCFAALLSRGLACAQQLVDLGGAMRPQSPSIRLPSCRPVLPAFLPSPDRPALPPSHLPVQGLCGPTSSFTLMPSCRIYVYHIPYIVPIYPYTHIPIYTYILLYTLYCTILYSIP
jgi:hypothetical protein